LPLSNRLLKGLGDYWRAQRQGKWGHDIPWLFLGYRAEPICTTSGQNIFYRAVKKSGVRYKGGIHTLRHSFATHLIESGVLNYERVGKFVYGPIFWLFVLKRNCKLGRRLLQGHRRFSHF
jgi:integrase